jgi:hypothetical protein
MEAGFAKEDARTERNLHRIPLRLNRMRWSHLRVAATGWHNQDTLGG